MHGSAERSEQAAGGLFAMARPTSVSPRNAFRVEDMNDDAFSAAERIGFCGRVADADRVGFGR